MASTGKQEIAYRLYRESDADEMAVLLSEVFTERDPPAVAVGLTQPEFERFVRLFCPRAAEQSLTIVARCVATDRLCGVLLAEDSATGMPSGVDGLSARFRPVFDILGQLDEDYRGDSGIASGQSIHLFLLGVSRQYSGQGVAQQLVSQCLANAANRGYCAAVTEATNPTSQHIFRKHGFVDRVSRSYRTHEYAGARPFMSIAEHGGPILMDKQLTGNGRY